MYSIKMVIYICHGAYDLFHLTSLLVCFTHTSSKRSPDSLNNILQIVWEQKFQRGATSLKKMTTFNFTKQLVMHSLGHGCSLALMYIVFININLLDPSHDVNTCLCHWKFLKVIESAKIASLSLKSVQCNQLFSVQARGFTVASDMYPWDFHERNR
jgi:hypothetical protein